MRQNKSKINGVRNEHRQMEGRTQFFQVGQCSKCSATVEFTTKSAPMPRSIVFNKMREKGWKPYGNGAHVCPACQIVPAKPPNLLADPPKAVAGARGGKRERRVVSIYGVEYPTLRAAADAFGIPVSTLHHLIQNGTFDRYMSKRAKKISPVLNEEENTVTHEQTHVHVPEPGPEPKPAAPADTTPREMSREHRRRIWRHLEDVYDVASGRYTDANTDHVVAERLKVPRAWVAEVRDEAFGPEGSNDEMEKLRKEIVALSGKLSKAVETCLNAATDAEELQGEAKRMEARFRALRDLVGPQAHKVK